MSIGQKVYALPLLGVPVLHRRGEAVPLGRRKALNLLTYLAFGKRVRSRETLAALFRPEHDQPHARGSLRRLLSQLRLELGQDMPPREKERVGPLNLEMMTADIEEFQELLARARRGELAGGRGPGGGRGGAHRRLGVAPAGGAALCQPDDGEHPGLVRRRHDRRAQMMSR